MKEEFETLGKQLKELAEKYGYNYLTIAYVNGSISGNSSREEDNFISVYLPKEEGE